MSEIEPCIHGIEDPAWCTLCSGKDKKEEMRVTVKYSFKAKYGGCMDNGHCEHFVKVGETIACLSDGCFVCADCAEEFE